MRSHIIDIPSSPKGSFGDIGNLGLIKIHHFINFNYLEFLTIKRLIWLNKLI